MSVGDDSEQATKLLALMKPIYKSVPLSSIDYGLIEKIADSAEKKLKDLSTVVLEGLKPPAGPYSFFHHSSHCLSRLGDCLRTSKRLFQQVDELNKISREIEKSTPKDWPSGEPYPEEIQKMMRQEGELNAYMKQDLETLFMFGVILLDQWALQVIHIANLDLPKKHPFDELVSFLQSSSESIVSPIWKEIESKTIWLYFQLKFYRNKFIVHANRPWQRGTTRGFVGNDYKLFTPTPPGWLDDEALDKEIRLFGKIFNDKAHAGQVIQHLFDSIGQIKDRNERNKVAELFGKKGGSTASFQVLALRLFEFIDQATEILIPITKANLSNINLGAPFLNSDQWRENKLRGK